MRKRKMGFIEVVLISFATDPVKRMERQITEWEKCLQIKYLTEDQNLEYKIETLNEQHS